VRPVSGSRGHRPAGFAVMPVHLFRVQFASINGNVMHVEPPSTRCAGRAAPRDPVLHWSNSCNGTRGRSSGFMVVLLPERMFSVYPGRSGRPGA
jgi:hypothetical protein